MRKPQSIQFESTAYCNAKCTFCPPFYAVRKRGRMSEELFHKIIQQGKEMGIRRFVPFLNGEPFSDPRIFNWLDYMQEQGTTTCIFTNASLLNTEKIDRLVKYKNIEYINCSLNAATAETYKKVVGLDNFEKTVDNIKYLIANAPFKVKVGMTIVQENAHEKRMFKRMWGKNSKTAEFVNWGGDVHDSVEKIGERTPCYFLMSKITILWDGRVSLCCFDNKGEVILGDVNNEHLRDIWIKAKPIRDRHYSLDFDMPLCRDCNANAYKTKLVG